MGASAKGEVEDAVAKEDVMSAIMDLLAGYKTQRRAILDEENRDDVKQRGEVSLKPIKEVALIWGLVRGGVNPSPAFRQQDSRLGVNQVR